MISCMNITENFITRKFCIGNDTDGKQIKNLIKALMLLDHLVVNGIKMLGSAEDTELDMLFL